MPQIVMEPLAEARQTPTASSASNRHSTVTAESNPVTGATLQPRGEPRSEGGSGEATIRVFYEALGAGDGERASAQVIAEKRSSGAFSPGAISRFYGDLPEPIRLTEIAPLARGVYRVSYRYAAGRSPCDGRAIVSLTHRGDRNLIRSIRALNGC